MARGRKSKSALNQSSKTNVFVNESDVEKLKELHDIDLIEEAKEMASEEFDVPSEEINVEVVPEELPTLEEIEEEIEGEEKPEELVPEPTESPEFENDGQEEGETVVEEDGVPTKEQLMSLSKAGYRFYQRTGKLPK